MKLTHSQRATARHLGMSEDDYLKRDRLVDLTRSTMLKVHAQLAEALAEHDRVGAELGDHAPRILVESVREIQDKVDDYLRCSGCGVHPGQRHQSGCDVARCKGCGWQDISCDCEEKSDEMTLWTGEWPGKAEVAEYQLLDLNMLAVFQARGLLVWDRDDERLYQSPNHDDERWQTKVAEYVEAEQKMSDEIMANWHRSWTP
ncbi:hypothetical protein BI081_gp102 [Mycobacterium phage Tonenili]|uniref:Uncharacterized protein n=1 Tax=Mycobacterium phage Tonenili TaxID=1891703 RepID=A0A1C9EHN7_9CAUD|nr:hypothetical protein BI081_gp102 [Mycobacterium phage Tonenili]AON97005.1 hypothetical protein SEA_TONENILI_287 [Mycobacterium phage Tonenili]